MKCLAIETSSLACSVALAIDDEIHAIHKIAPMHQSQLILAMIDELLKSKKLTLNQLDTFAFGCGPGSFTGVRIACSVIQGLAFALNLPIIPISSLAATAQTAYQIHRYKKMLVAVDARMQETYWANYTANEKGLMVLDGIEHLSKPEEIILPSDTLWLGVGNAWEVYKDHITREPSKLYVDCVPTAASVAYLAKEKYHKQAWVSATEAHPTYLRNNVATKSS